MDAESFALVLQLSGFELIDILKTCVLRKQFSNLLKTEQTYSCNFRCDDVIGVKFHTFVKRVKVIQHTDLGVIWRNFYTHNFSKQISDIFNLPLGGARALHDVINQFCKRRYV